MAEVIPHSVLRIGKSSSCVVVLKERDASRYLPIWTSARQAQPIVLSMQGLRTTRPQSHELLVKVADALGAAVVRIHVYGVEQGVALARIAFSTHHEEITIECRLSDALAIAIREGVPIMVAEEVMEKATVSLPQREADASAIEGEELETRLEVFQDFIDTLDLDDF